jgi:hypothetical protein
VLQLLDRHNRDCETVAKRLEQAYARSWRDIPRAAVELVKALF